MAHVKRSSTKVFKLEFAVEAGVCLEHLGLGHLLPHCYALASGRTGSVAVELHVLKNNDSLLVNPAATGCRRLDMLVFVHTQGKAVETACEYCNNKANDECNSTCFCHVGNLREGSVVRLGADSVECSVRVWCNTSCHGSATVEESDDSAHIFTLTFTESDIKGNVDVPEIQQTLAHAHERQKTCNGQGSSSGAAGGMPPPYVNKIPTEVWEELRGQFKVLHDDPRPVIRMSTEPKYKELDDCMLNTIRNIGKAYIDNIGDPYTKVIVSDSGYVFQASDVPIDLSAFTNGHLLVLAVDGTLRLGCGRSIDRGCFMAARVADLGGRMSFVHAHEPTPMCIWTVLHTNVDKHIYMA
jgi:hypothetical protein